jgi:hypothetical protein
MPRRLRHSILRASTLRCMFGKRVTIRSNAIAASARELEPEAMYARSLPTLKEYCDRMRERCFYSPPEKLITDDDGSADIHAAEEVENVLVMHSDTAVARETANGARAVGAVNCVFAAAREGKRGGTHRIVRRAPGNHVR